MTYSEAMEISQRVLAANQVGFKQICNICGFCAHFTCKFPLGVILHYIAYVCVKVCVKFGVKGNFV